MRQRDHLHCGNGLSGDKLAVSRNLSDIVRLVLYGVELGMRKHELAKIHVVDVLVLRRMCLGEMIGLQMSTLEQIYR